MKNSIVLIALFISILGFSQETEQPDIKVGLVLSGGGAKGLAHIGTLKVIDSLGIRVDYISGTSMGAIIGALYATGYSGNQIDSIFKEINFDDIINDNLPRKAKTFYERENSEKYAVTLPFEKFKIKLPTALSRGQNTLSLLSQLTLHVSDVNDFSNLPIPFFCIATNIETGEAVILDKGSLAQSITASAAFPSLFQPVIINDQILIDGGVVNNYPIDELKAKGMDVIIGVDVQDELATRERLKSAPNILLQINNYRTFNEMKKKSKKTDIYIKPDITDYNVISFDFGDQIIKNGEKAALKQVHALNELVAKQTIKRAPFERIHPIDSIRINSIAITGNDKYSRSYILGKLKFRPDTTIKYKTFIEGVNNLAATNNFESVNYQLKLAIDNTSYDMFATIKESSVTTFFKLGVHFDDLYKSAAIVNVTKKRFLTNDDVLSFDFILGDNIRYDMQYYIDKGFYWSFGVNSRYNHFSKNVLAGALLSPEELLTINVNKLDIDLDDITNRVYLQTLFRKDFALTVGAEHKFLTITSETILTGTNERRTTFEKSNYVGAYGKLKLDTYDSKYFPNEGVLFDGDFVWYMYSSDFNKNFEQFSIAKATIGYTTSFNKFTANITTQGGFKIGEDKNPYLDFVLGGYGHNLINNFSSFYGYDFISIGGNSFVKGVITLDYEIFKKNHVNFAANYANVDDNIFDSGEWISSPDYSGYALGYSIESFLGPIEAKYTWSPETKKSIWFVNIGFWF